jgi:cytidylate kinase
VLEGRDIGTVVFPDAELKVFLTASPAERARRRAIDMVDRGVDMSVDEVLTDLMRRDSYDSNREASPLMQAPDAVVLDTTGLTIDQVVGRIAELFEERRGTSDGSRG